MPVKTVDIGIPILAMHSACELSFVTTADRDGRRTYRRSVVLLLQRAIYDVYGLSLIHI